MIATLALTAALLAPPAGELIWWRPDGPASGLEVTDDAVWRGLGAGRSEWWPLDGDPPRLMARTTPCPSTLESYDPPRATLPGRALPWGPVVAHGWSDACALTSTAAGPLVRYRRWRIAEVMPRAAPARLVATDPTCTRGAVVDDDVLRLFALEGDAAPIVVPLDRAPTDLRLTAEAAIVADLEGGLSLYRVDGQRLASIELGAPLSCAATGRGLLVAETVEGQTRGHAMADGALRWGRAPVDDELGQGHGFEPPARVAAMAASDDGRWIAAIFDGSARVWRPATGAVELLPGPAVDVAAGPDGRLAVRGPQRVTIWRLDGPRARRERSAPAPEMAELHSPSMAWTGRGVLMGLTDDGVQPLVGTGRGAAVEAPRVLVPAGDRLLAVADGHIAELGGRPITIRRPPGPVDGARLDCDGRPVAPGLHGWRRLDATSTDERAPVRLCPPSGSSPSIRFDADGVVAARIVRTPGHPPERREVRAPLLGEVRRLSIDGSGRITALLDDRAVVRWHPDGAPDRLTWVVVDGHDVIAGGGRIRGDRGARRALAWWTPEGVVSAADAPTDDGALPMVEGAP